MPSSVKSACRLQMFLNFANTSAGFVLSNTHVPAMTEPCRLGLSANGKQEVIFLRRCHRGIVHVIGQLIGDISSEFRLLVIRQRHIFGCYWTCLNESHGE